MGTKGKVTFIYANESGDVVPNTSSVYITPQGQSADGASAVQMSDADSNGTYVVDIEDDLEAVGNVDSGRFHIYAAGIKEIEEFMVISQDLIDDVTAHGVSITDHESSISSFETDLAIATGNIDSLQGSVSSLVIDVASMSSSLNTHLIDTSDPHGGTMSISSMLTVKQIQAQSNNDINLEPNDSSGLKQVVILNAGGSATKAAHLRLKFGELRWGDGGALTPRIYPLMLALGGSIGLVIDVRKSSGESKLWVTNSEAGQECKLVVDGGISGDVGEVVNARGSYANLNNRLTNMDTDLAIGERRMAMNMNPGMGVSSSGGISIINNIIINEVFLPHTTIIDTLMVYVTTASASVKQDFGIYDGSGAQLFTTGPTAFSSVGSKELSLSACYNLSPGKHYFAFTSNTSAVKYLGFDMGYEHVPRWGTLAGGGQTLPVGSLAVDNISEAKVLFPWIVLKHSTTS